jgi:hypothetical protein
MGRAEATEHFALVGFFQQLIDFDGQVGHRAASRDYAS